MRYTELTPNVKWNCPPSDNWNILILYHPQRDRFKFICTKLKTVSSLKRVLQRSGFLKNNFWLSHTSINSATAPYGELR